MTIRKVTASDSENLRQLLEEFEDYSQKAVISDEIRPFTVYKNQAETIADTVKMYLEENRYSTYVAEDTGKLIGFICGEVIEKKYKVKDTEGLIEDWFVSKEYREKGVGKELYNALVKEFQEKGCNRLALETFATNGKALDKYHHMGFKDLTIKLIKDIA